MKSYLKSSAEYLEGYLGGYLGDYLGDYLKAVKIICIRGLDWIVKLSN